MRGLRVDRGCAWPPRAVTLTIPTREFTAAAVYDTTMRHFSTGSTRVHYPGPLRARPDRRATVSVLVGFGARHVSRETAGADFRRPENASRVTDRIAQEPRTELRGDTFRCGPCFFYLRGHVGAFQSSRSLPSYSGRSDATNDGRESAAAAFHGIPACRVSRETRPCIRLCALHLTHLTAKLLISNSRL